MENNQTWICEWCDEGNDARVVQCTNCMRGKRPSGIGPGEHPIEDSDVTTNWQKQPPRRKR